MLCEGENAAVPAADCAAGTEVCRVYLKAIGEGDGAGQAPGVMYSK